MIMTDSDLTQQRNKQEMKRLMAMTTMALLAASLNATSLAEARGKIDAAVSDPAQLTELMKQLSASDQRSFVAAVNEAVSKLPGSAEERCAKFVNVTRAALKGSAKGNARDLEALIAEVYATAPLEALCALNEDLAKDMFNRAADTGRTYTDDQFAKIATNVVAAVNERVAGAEDADVRGGFAALMMIRASNGSPASLAGDLAGTLGDSAAVARNEWFPEALRNPANYDPMLASTAVDKAPDARSVAVIVGAQRHETLLSDFFQHAGDPASFGDGLGDMSRVQSFDHDLYTRPRTMEDEKWNPDPRPYFGQVTH